MKHWRKFTEGFIEVNPNKSSGFQLDRYPIGRDTFPHGCRASMRALYFEYGANGEQRLITACVYQDDSYFVEPHDVVMYADGHADHLAKPSLGIILRGIRQTLTAQSKPEKVLSASSS